MRTLIVTEMLSLDGVIDSPGGGDHPRAGWTFKDVEFVPDAYEIKGREQLDAAAMLLGRVSFQDFAPVWPSMADFPQYNEMPKYVVTTTLSDEDVTGTDWQNCHRLTSIDDVRRLKEGEGGPIIVHGSASLAKSLAAAGLVDRYHLLEFPLVLGAGKRLFDDTGDAYRTLTLVESATYPNGIRMAIYDVAPAKDES